MTHEPTFAQIAVPLFEQLHKEGFYGASFRHAAYLVSKDLWDKLEAAAKKDGHMYEDQTLAMFGFWNLFYKGTPVLYSTDLPPGTVFPITHNFVEALAHRKSQEDRRKYNRPVYRPELPPEWEEINTVEDRPGVVELKDDEPKDIFNSIMLFTPRILRWPDRVSEIAPPREVAPDTGVARSEDQAIASDDESAIEQNNLLIFKQFER
jgi:hypothetical protein